MKLIHKSKAFQSLCKGTNNINAISMYQKKHKPANIYLIIGASGSGKTTVAEIISERYGLTILPSYTTRPKRKETDVDHIYISVDEYIELPNKVATNCTNNNFYCATKEQVDNNDLYVIDHSGLKMMRECYLGAKKCISIFIDLDTDTRIERMKLRGDNKINIAARLSNDFLEFDGCKEICDYVVDGLVSKEVVVSQIWNIICENEKWDEIYGKE